MYFVRHNWVVGAPKDAKSANICAKWCQKYKIVNLHFTFLCFHLHFPQILALFATSSTPTIHLCLTRYIVGIGLFAQQFLSVHLWIYSVSNLKLAKQMPILYFWTSFCPNFVFYCRFETLYNQPIAIFGCWSCIFPFQEITGDGVMAFICWYLYFGGN